MRRLCILAVWKGPSKCHKKWYWRQFLVMQHCNQSSNIVCLVQTKKTLFTKDDHKYCKKAKSWRLSQRKQLFGLFFCFYTIEWVCSEVTIIVHISKEPLAVNIALSHAIIGTVWTRLPNLSCFACTECEETLFGQFFELILVSRAQCTKIGYLKAKDD